MKDEKFTILLTGAYGFLGKEILNFFSGKEGVSVKTCGRNPKCNYIFDLATDDIRFTNHFDLVVHAAGKAHSTPKSLKEEKLYYDVNVLGTNKLIKALEKSGNLPKAFLYVSSVSVYGLVSGEQVDESRPLLATDPYGLSKIEAEKIVLSFCQKHKITCTIFRLPLLVGESPPGNLGAMIRGIKKGFYFNIAGGLATKSMVLSTDVAKFILQATKKGGIYNLTDGYNPSFSELSKHIASQCGKSFVPNIPLSLVRPIAILGDFLGSGFPINSDKLLKITSSLTFDDSKARTIFGWEPTPVLKGYKIDANAK